MGPIFQCCHPKLFARIVNAIWRLYFQFFLGHFLFLFINQWSVRFSTTPSGIPSHRCYSCVSFNFGSLSLPSNGIVPMLQMLPKCSFELERLSTLFQIKSFVNISKWQENAFYGVFINLCQNQLKNKLNICWMLFVAVCNEQEGMRFGSWKITFKFGYRFRWVRCCLERNASLPVQLSN